MYANKGPFVTYTLHKCVFGRKSDKDLKKITPTVGIQQVFSNLLNIFSRLFMRRGYTATLDSAHMGELLAQVVTKAWEIIVIRTMQVNHCRPDTDLMKSDQTNMKKDTYECNLLFKTSCLSVLPYGRTITLLQPSQTTTP
jgi:hypothetical protein